MIAYGSTDYTFPVLLDENVSVYKDGIKHDTRSEIYEYHCSDGKIYRLIT